MALGSPFLYRSVFITQACFTGWNFGGRPRSPDQVTAGHLMRSPQELFGHGALPQKPKNPKPGRFHVLEEREHQIFGGGFYKVYHQRSNCNSQLELKDPPEKYLLVSSPLRARSLHRCYSLFLLYLDVQVLHLVAVRINLPCSCTWM